MPDSATMFASTPNCFIATKHSEHGERQQPETRCRAAEVRDHHEDDDDRHEDLVSSSAVLSVVERLEDQARAVVEGHDRRAATLRVPSSSVLATEPGAISRDLLLHALDHRQRVRAVAHDDHAPDRLGAALVEQALAAAPDPQRDLADLRIVIGTWSLTPTTVSSMSSWLSRKPEPAHDVLGAVDLDRARADVDVRPADTPGRPRRGSRRTRASQSGSTSIWYSCTYPPIDATSATPSTLDSA